MQQLIPPPLLALAKALSRPLYVVGGSVRDFLAGFDTSTADWDICSPAAEEEVEAAAAAVGITVNAVYRNTGTVKLAAPDGTAYEFTRFRSDRYVRGVHTPVEITFTEDIVCDARRRDFCANAVYYDIAADAYRDPLDGIGDIHVRRLRTVAPPEKVFGEDGLRLARLARLAAQTGFEPDEACLLGARQNAALIRDIAPERIFHELDLLLHADAKPGGEWGPYRGLKILQETGVLGEIMPELAAGDGMAQRPDFHRYDVLEHSLRCVYYAPPAIRWAALLHDVGKPLCMKRDGNTFDHPAIGEKLTVDILTRLKAPVRLRERTARLVALHMRYFDPHMRESKVRMELVENVDLLPDLFALRQADFSACKDDPSPAPGVEKWKAILAAMHEEGVPFRLKDLALNGRDLAALGITGEGVGRLLKELLRYCALDGRRNQREALLCHLKHCKEIP